MKIAPKVVILRTAGTNCDRETAYAFQLAGADTCLIHINELLAKREILKNSQILAIPGGFTYGDDLGSGRILANEIRYKLSHELSDFVSRGNLVIGICNGFQVLVKMGLLPNSGNDPEFKVQEATLSLNDSGKFEDRWIYLKRQGDENNTCVWTKALPEVISLPIAHAEGKFIPMDDRTLDVIKKNRQIVFRYSDVTGKSSGYPINPNGSIDDIAGICDTTGRILGLMPHPERHVTYLQHPNWRRRAKEDRNMGIGLMIFKNGVNFAKDNL